MHGILKADSVVKMTIRGEGLMERKSYIAMKHDFLEASERQFAAGKYYVILYISRGTVYFDIDGEIKLCSTEDVIILKPDEKTTMHFRGGRYQLQILELRVLPEFLRELSDEKTKLEEGFDFVPFKVTVVHAGSEESMLIKNIALKLSTMEQEEMPYGQKLYEKNLISMLLILSLRACIGADRVHKSRKRRHIMMDDIFTYIGEHLTEDLTLEQLEKEFFVSRYHICREFKRLTGQTPHAYIVKARLDLCRKYIEQGKAISEVYQLGGFGGYNHFFRAFKKEYGMTPMQYYKNLEIRKEEF